MQNKIFYIPTKTKYIVISDLFAEDYSGGAELTLEALLEKSPGNVFKIHSRDVTPELIEKNKDKIWILGNYAGLSKESIIELVTSATRYFIVECDYKYCRYRSSHLHFLQENKECDCHKTKHGLFTRAFFSKAQKVFFMSSEQMNLYVSLFPSVGASNFSVLSSVFSDDTLEQIKSLRHQRAVNGNNTWAILSGGSWIKAEKDTIAWCESQNLHYELIGGLKPDKFLEKLATMHGLVFRPAGFDTCPRIVIEAKLLGLELKLNDNVQHKDELWFGSDIETCEKYLQTRAEVFWEQIIL